MAARLKETGWYASIQAKGNRLSAAADRGGGEIKQAVADGIGQLEWRTRDTIIRVPSIVVRSWTRCRSKALLQESGRSGPAGSRPPDTMLRQPFLPGPLDGNWSAELPIVIPGSVDAPQPGDWPPRHVAPPWPGLSRPVYLTSAATPVTAPCFPACGRPCWTFMHSAPPVRDCRVAAGQARPLARCAAPRAGVGPVRRKRRSPACGPDVPGRPVREARSFCKLIWPANTR